MYRVWEQRRTKIRHLYKGARKLNLRITSGIEIGVNTSEILYCPWAGNIFFEWMLWDRAQHGNKVLGQALAHLLTKIGGDKFCSTISSRGLQCHAYIKLLCIGPVMELMGLNHKSCLLYSNMLIYNFIRFLISCFRHKIVKSHQINLSFISFN